VSLGGEIGKNLASGSSRKYQVRSDRHDPALRASGHPRNRRLQFHKGGRFFISPHDRKRFIVYADENLTAFSNLTESDGMTVTE
jgi:hypothetical protein